MKEQFVSYEIALKLKGLGFDEKCLGFWYVSQINNSCIELRHGMCIFKSTSIELSKYPKNVLAPLWQQAIDWFREKYKINCIVGYTDNDKEEFMAVIDRPNQDIDYNMNPTESYYEAREQAILKAIELCQKE